MQCPGSGRSVSTARANLRPTTRPRGWRAWSAGRTFLFGVGTLAIFTGILLGACGGRGELAAPDAPEAPESGETPNPYLTLVAVDATAPRGLPGAAVDVAADDLARAYGLLEDAASFERDGFWEAAADTRGRVIEGDLGRALPPFDLHSAQLAQASLLLQLGQAGAALVLIESVDRTALDETNANTLALLEARATDALGERDSAIDALTRYLEADGAAAVTALLMRSDFLIGTNRVDEAEADLRAAIGHHSALEDQIAEARIDLGSLYEVQGLYSEAREQYVALLNESPGYEAAALHRLGSVAWVLGDAITAEQWWLQLLQDYPWHWRSTDALFQLDVGGVAVNPVVRGVVLYRHARSDEAREALTSFLQTEPFLQTQPPAAERHVATYYLAAIAEDEGRGPEAVVGYLSAVAADPEGDLADNALWWAARVSEELQDLPFAALLYRRLADSYPASPFAADARFLNGLMLFLYGDITTAQSVFATLDAEDATADAQRGLLWSGKTLALLEDPAAAAAYATAAALDPHAYYGLRAEALLADQVAAPSLTPPQPGIPSSLSGSDTVTWLIESFGVDSPERREAVLGAADWRAAVELQAAGLSVGAEAHFHALIETYGTEPWVLYLLALQFDALGLPHLRIAAAAAILASFAGEELVGAPPELLAWTYPTDWQPIADREAAAGEFDPLLLYSLVRQESRFNPDAGSPVGALGLTQVIGPTGGWIAEQLSDDNFNTADLFRPHVAIRYGAFYLSVQLDMFEGSAALALAAYNAGPGNSSRWSDGDPGIDPDLFFERVTFGETNLYLRTVLENYAWYRFIYGGAPAPTLVD
jgi:soluble lytic murein transglycosylase